MVAHPCQYSPEVIEALRSRISANEHIHDPFAGTGLRLGALCDEIGASYSGSDIEVWPGHDERVRGANSLSLRSYPKGDFTVVTSPVYLNKRLADYANGPLPTTKTKGRRDYGISLGRALHADNLARHTGKISRADMYWALHSQAVKHWKTRVLVNVDLPIRDGWCGLLMSYGYKIDAIAAVYTQRYGGLDNAKSRSEHEVLIEAHRLSLTVHRD